MVSILTYIFIKNNSQFMKFIQIGQIIHTIQQIIYLFTATKPHFSSLQTNFVPFSNI